MKKQIIFVGFVLAIIIGLAVLAFSKPDTDRVPANLQPSGRTVTIPANAVEVAPGVFDLGTPTVNGEVLQGYMFIHYKDEFTHKPNHGGGATSSSSCFAFLSPGARWKITEPYIIGPGIDIALTETSLEAWDSQVAFEIFGTLNASAVVDGADTSSPDNKNEILFGDVASPGAIAVTTVWGIFSGPPSGRKLVEFDAVFDNVDFTFGDAATSAQTVMDFQNIATHEFGHAGGMGHPSDSCTEETMYRFASFNETKKRTLNAGDISGVRSLYK